VGEAARCLLVLPLWVLSGESCRSGCCPFRDYRLDWAGTSSNALIVSPVESERR